MLRHRGGHQLTTVQLFSDEKRNRARKKKLREKIQVHHEKNEHNGAEGVKEKKNDLFFGPEGRGKALRSIVYK